MRWPWRKRADSAPLLSDAEMAKLHEEIFGEDVSIERLYGLLAAARAADRGPLEWVMDLKTMNRIRMAHLPPPTSVFSFMNLETTRKYVDAVAPRDQLLGVPIVIEPFAKLAIRRRTDPAPSDASPGSGAAPQPLAATPRDG